MKFENTELETVIANLNVLDDIMKVHGLERGEHWDYDRVTYDRKLEIEKDVYYLRVQGYATEGDIGANHATIQLLKPILGKHYYPHGVEYGSDEHFPEHLVKECETVLNAIKSQINEFSAVK
ncbi:YugN family protein [Niallia sp. Krafla_26]|uniref:YugN family protein n=1 Tax=Niallia sp. Krafla_26 TaxID=3064703 RepID=UPI003D16AC16